MNDNIENLFDDLDGINKSEEKVEQPKKIEPTPISKNVPIGYELIPIEHLPSKGKFYPIGTKIAIRSANSREIEHYSTMQEQSPLDIENHFNDIISSCCQIKIGAMLMSYKDLLEGDKLFLLLAIKDKTFLESENILKLEIQCKKCSHINNRELKNNILDSKSECEEMLERYYDSSERCYVVKTKNYGEINLYPPKVGVTDFILNYGVKKEQQKKYWNKALISLIPYLTNDWKSLDDKEIDKWDGEIKSWSKNKYSIIYRLIEKLKIGINPEVVIKCDSCGAEVSTPFDFPGGPKSLFIISDISDELL